MLDQWSLGKQVTQPRVMRPLHRVSCILCTVPRPTLSVGARFEVLVPCGRVRVCGRGCVRKIMTRGLMSMIGVRARVCVHARVCHQIVKRQTDLGIGSILPAFQGNVPKNLALLFPKANISKQSAGGSSTGWGWLDGLDPLFRTIAEMVLSELVRGLRGSASCLHKCTCFPCVQPAPRQHAKLTLRPQ